MRKYFGVSLRATTSGSGFVLIRFKNKAQRLRFLESLNDIGYQGSFSLFEEEVVKHETR